jgi:hypothetical protein
MAYVVVTDYYDLGCGNFDIVRQYIADDPENIPFEFEDYTRFPEPMQLPWGKEPSITSTVLGYGTRVSYHTQYDMHLYEDLPRHEYKCFKHEHGNKIHA